MEKEVLEEIGLTPNQAEVYLSLLKLGSSNAQKIIKESGLHRSRVYDSIEKLEELGIVKSVVKDYKRFFQAVEPERLLGFIEEKKDALRNIMPKLKELEGQKKEEISAAIYKGKEGLKTIHAEMLKQKGDILVLGAKGYIYDELEYFMPQFQREQQNLRNKFICLWDTEKLKEKSLKKAMLTQGKVLPEGFTSNAVANIFGDKVAIVLWKEKYPTGFMIDNKDVADAFRKWFKLVWKASE